MTVTVETEKAGRTASLRYWYRFAALAVFNSILLLLLLNLVLYLVTSTKRPAKQEDDSLQRYGDRVLKGYPGWREEDVRVLLKETYRDAAMEYEPFTEFKNKPLHERFVRVDPAGFRFSKDQAPWPPRAENFNIFVFGGSTTFGMGLPDDETIASYLQECAPANQPGPVAVYNFARTYYFSSQERILFQQLLMSGFVPRVAIFIDGLNDFGFPDGQPRFTEKFKRFMDGKEQGGGFSRLDGIPMIKAAHWLTVRWAKSNVQKTTDDLGHRVPERAVLESVANRWIANKKIIELLASGYGVRPLFVWQPVPTYNYDLRYHLLLSSSFKQPEDDYTLKEKLWYQGRLGPTVMGVANGYAIMESLRAQGNLGANVLWLADLQQDKQENLYVDAVHYNAAFSKEIAGRIWTFLSEPPERRQSTPGAGATTASIRGK